ncbi:MAG: hypothetical protein IH588_14930 [Anaerolineales bacterium]|nr:hypothetical protein [Anaerolineales bacterium]
MAETYFCHHCQQSITLPDALDNSIPDETVRLSRINRNIDAMFTLQVKFGVGLGDAKFITQHISKSKGRCANCGKNLLEDGITYCPHCSGLNFNW